ncbi:cysteine-rich secretory protein 3-like [Gracilinanus agilis]|uniref:cysteine-rich secretory protein 3-like n=1 Tax=Gracilinanus agilis TaxID=191870 RepID=UPI001CFF27C9|nr:cysteine-rich secretory protein 3-like [Gracilinanus agilis]
MATRIGRWNSKQGGTARWGAVPWGWGNNMNGKVVSTSYDWRHDSSGNHSAMILFHVLLCLTTLLLSSCATQNPTFESLSTKNNNIQEEIVNKHNDLRANVKPAANNMLKMKWSPEAQESAQAWANKCTLQHSTIKDRTIGNPCGENLFMSTVPMKWSKAIQDWYDEVSNFEYGKGAIDPTKPIGHYTQVVWFSSYKVGCGIAYCPNAAFPYFYVCQYCPSGNYKTNPYEKGPSCDKCPNSCSNKLCTNPCQYTDNISNCEDLKKQVSCQHEILKNKCKATCHCANKIH